MAQLFDPYHKWLGIPPEEQPANHYRLLGISRFESDPDVIDAACDQRMAYLQQCATGPNGALSQALLNEVSAARVCLLDAQRRAVYDATLATGSVSNEPAEPASHESAAGPWSRSHAGFSPWSTLLGGRRWQRSWILWIGLSAFALYVGWTYLLWPVLMDRPAGADQPQSSTIGHRQEVDDSQPSEVVLAGTASFSGQGERIPVAFQDEPHSSGAPAAAQGRSGEQSGPSVLDTATAATGPATPPVASGRRHFSSVELPALNDTSSEILADLTEVDAAAQLQVRGAAAAIDPGDSLHLEDPAARDRWTVCISAGDTHRPIAEFTRQAQSLHFRWLKDAAEPTAVQLKNCLLRYSLGRATHVVALRKAVMMPPLSLNLNESFHRHAVDLIPLPRRDSLHLEVTGVTGLAEPVDFRDGVHRTALGKKDVRIAIKDADGVALRVAFDAYGRSGVSVKVGLEYPLEGHRTMITLGRVARMRAKLPKEFAQAQSELRQREEQLASAGIRLTRMRRQTARNLLEVAEREVNLRSLEREIQFAEKQVKRLRERLPVLQRQLGTLLPALEGVVEAVHNSAAVEYRVFSEVGGDELELLRGGATTPRH